MVLYTVQWLLAYAGCFSAKDTHSWLDIPTAVCEIGMFFFGIYSHRNTDKDIYR